MRSGEDSWSEAECILALWAYYRMDLGQYETKKALYAEVARLTGRGPKAVEWKIQNVSACDPRPRPSKPISEAPNKQILLKRLFDHWWPQRDALSRAHHEALRAFSAGQAMAAAVEADGPAPPLGPLSPLQRRACLQGVRERIAAASELGTLRTVERWERRGQGLFALAVLLRFQDALGADANACPGCGHARTKEGSAPLLQAHHILPFRETASMDDRWGIPLCPNCHALLEHGPRSTKAEIWAEVLRRYPDALTGLKELEDAGVLSDEDKRRLWEDGLRLPQRPLASGGRRK